MEQHELKRALSHVLWIGGATDTGKTTITKTFAEKYGLQAYHYDHRDQAQIEQLAQRLPRYRSFLDATLEERWLKPEPEDLLRFTLTSFQDRFPLVLEELEEMPTHPMILAEGFGFTPELLFPILSNVRQAVWLVPTEEFKRASMQRRNKPSFKDKVSDPERAVKNVFERDMLLARRVSEQAEARGLTVFEVDGTRTIKDLAALIEQYLTPYIMGAGK